MDRKCRFDDNAGAPITIYMLKYQPFTFSTMSKGSYDVKMIREAFSEKQRRYLLDFCHAFTGCDTVSAIAGHGKNTLYLTSFVQGY